MISVFLGAVGALADGELAVGDLFGAADSLVVGGRSDLAGQLFRLWLSANPASPLLHAVCFNYGVLASSSGDLAGARAAYERAIVADLDFIPARINLGGVLEQLGAPTEAVAQWRGAVDRLSHITGPAVKLKTLALRQLGRVMDGNDRDAAESALRQILEFDSSQPDIAEHFIALRLLQCKTPVIAPPEGVSRETLLRNLHPLSAAAYVDHPLFLLAVNWNFNRRRVDTKITVLEPLPPQSSAHTPPHRRLRIGYLSSDLCAHAVGYLVVEAIETHNRDLVETFVYYCGPPASDWINVRIKAAADHWVDINSMDDDTAARQILGDNIDILIDLNGATKGARTGVCARRPAPVIVNWLGFPGTMATPYHHYIIADDWIIPSENEIYVSEKVVRLPCYQPNDRKRQVAELRPTRAEAGLPDDAIVYCCFNWTQKISRHIIKLWMDILSRVPSSVLWLLDTNKETSRLLAQLAVERGIAAERVVFGQWMSSPDHLARYPLADVFLDTYPYGAHTTASDALWMGVPIVTLSGQSFASRVCGSLARSAGLADLVCSTAEEYVERAVELGHSPDLVKRYKAQLAETHDSCTLFDTDRLVHCLEEAYVQMWAEYQQGKLPIPDLTNLNVYLDSAVEDDLENFDFGAVVDYRAWFKQKLASRHRSVPIPPDKRLWRD